MNTLKFIMASIVGLHPEKLLIVLFLTGICTIVQAQNKVHSGTFLKIPANSCLLSASDLVLKNGGNINNSGTVLLKAGFVNQGGSATDIGEGAYIFNGSAQQTISGANRMGSLTIDNSGGLILNGNTTITNSLNLLSGRVTLGENNLLLEPSANTSGNQNAASMIVATGEGELRKSFNGPGSFLFPVGDNDGIPEYTPVLLNFTQGDFAAGNYAGVNLVNEPFSTTSPSYLNRYWNVTSNGISNFICHTVYHYVPSDVTGNENNLYCTRVMPEPVKYYDRADVQWHQLSANWLNSFGTFTGQEPPNVYISPYDEAATGDISIQISPNPFQGQTEIRVKTAFSGNIIAEVYNLQGQVVKMLFEGYIPAGVEYVFHYADTFAGSQTLVCRVTSATAQRSQLMERIK